MKPKSLLGQASPLMIGRAGAAFLGFALPLILARALTAGAFGTYKQAFLLAATLQYLLQLGLAQSLYYFLPRAGPRGGSYLVNAMVLLMALGAAAAVVLLALGGLATRAFENPELHLLLPLVAAYTALIIASSPLEIALTAAGRTRVSALAFFGSEVLRIVAMSIPPALGYGVRGLLVGAVSFAALRLVATWVALFLTVGAGQPSRAVMSEQLRYALPYALAVALGVVQQQFHQYAVGASVDPAAYAIYAVGCFQVPLITLLYSPVSEILQVRIGEADAAGRPEQAAPLLGEAVGRLALPFLPLFVFLWVAAPELIRALYTDVYLRAVPIFRAFVCTVPLAMFTVDGVLRARARTGQLWHIYGAKLAATVVLVLAGLKLLGPMGAALGFAAAEAVARIYTLRAAARAVGASAWSVVPWRSVSRIAAAAAGAGMVVPLCRAAPLGALALLCLEGAVFGTALLGILLVLGEIPWPGRRAAAQPTLPV